LAGRQVAAIVESANEAVLVDNKVTVEAKHGMQPGADPIRTDHQVSRAAAGILKDQCPGRFDPDHARTHTDLDAGIPRSLDK
jgi:hypothetical protein